MEKVVDDVSKNQFVVIVLPVICGVLFIVAAFLEALLLEFLFFLGRVLIKSVWKCLECLGSGLTIDIEARYVSRVTH